MDPIKTGELIRALRMELGMTSSSWPSGSM